MYDGDTFEKKDKFSTKPAEGSAGSKSYVVRALAWNPDSTLLAVAQSDAIVFVYKLAASAETATEWYVCVRCVWWGDPELDVYHTYHHRPPFPPHLLPHAHIFSYPFPSLPFPLHTQGCQEVYCEQVHATRTGDSNDLASEPPHISLVPHGAMLIVLSLVATPPTRSDAGSDICYSAGATNLFLFFSPLLPGPKLSLGTSSSAPPPAISGMGTQRATSRSPCTT